MSGTDLKPASVLAFERKLDPSDALFASGLWADRVNSAAWPALHVRQKIVRGTLSNRLKAKDQESNKKGEAIEHPNLQLIDFAALPLDADTLKINFSLRVLPEAGQPATCNSADYRVKLQEAVQSYINVHGFGELAKRYVYNLANARFLWRNRLGAEQIEVHVAHWVDGQAKTTWVFDALQIPLHEFNVTGAIAGDIVRLAQLLHSALSGKQHVLLHITAFARVGAGQEVFPSQELILDKAHAGKRKTLYQIQGVAAMHSQKIGNALRTIDTWYAGAADNGPIAADPYGSVTTHGKAYRPPKKHNDFYTHLDNWVLKAKPPADEQQHFVMAVLLRGGVFGDVKKE